MGLSSTRSTRSSRTDPPPDIYALDLNEDARPIAEEPPISQIDDSSVVNQAASEQKASAVLAISDETAPNLHPANSSEHGHDKAATEQEESTIASEILSSIVGLGRSNRISSPAESAIQEPESPLIQKKRRRGGSGNLAQQSAAAVYQEISEIKPVDTQELTDADIKPHISEPEPEPLSPVASEQEVEADAPDVGSGDNRNSEDEAQEISDKEAAVVLQKGKRRRVSNVAATADSSGMIPESPSQPTRTKASKAKKRKVSSPAQQRQPKKAKSQTSQTAEPARAKLKVTGPIPVVVHRLTDGPVYDEEEPAADILNSEIPYAKRGGVNSIDVLSQICQEITQSGLDTLAEGGINTEDPTLKQEYRTKWQAVDAFARELQMRLLEHVCYNFLFDEFEMLISLRLSTWTTLLFLRNASVMSRRRSSACGKRFSESEQSENKLL